MAKYGNENAAAGGRSRSTVDRDRSYGGFGGIKGAMDGRPTRTAHTDFITPKYGWGDAQISDFGIMGGVSNMLKGIYGGNVYAGRTPQGFSHGTMRQGGGAGMDYGGGGMTLGGTGHAARMMAQRRAASAQRPQQGLMTGPAPAPQGLAFKPQSYGPKQINIPGAYSYGVNLPAWKYFG